MIYDYGDDHFKWNMIVRNSCHDRCVKGQIMSCHSSGNASNLGCRREVIASIQELGRDWSCILEGRRGSRRESKI